MSQFEERVIQLLERNNELLGQLLDQMRLNFQAAREWEERAQRRMQAHGLPDAQNKEDLLVQLCQRRDFIQSQLDGFRRYVSAMTSELPSEAKEALEAQIEMMGVPQQLAAIEEQISRVQREIEGEQRHKAPYVGVPPEGNQ